MTEDDEDMGNGVLKRLLDIVDSVDEVETVEST